MVIYNTRSKTRLAESRHKKENDFNDSFIEPDDESDSFRSKFVSFCKLFVILLCYSVTFVTLIMLGFWLSNFQELDKPTDDEEYQNVFVIISEDVSYIYDKAWSLWTDGSPSYIDYIYTQVSKFAQEPCVISFGIDVGLLWLFAAQHSMMSMRFLERFYVFRHLQDRHKLYRAFYVLFTGIAMQVVMMYWREIPIYLWSIREFIGPWVCIFKGIHLLSWACLYGTSLMLDLPDIVGLNQVIITTPNVTQKSPNLQLMYRVQRHMGFLPFMVILLVFPNMSLDRFFMTILTILYLYNCWKSEETYRYVKNMKRLRTMRN